jgi:hypothetical protein
VGKLIHLPNAKPEGDGCARVAQVILTDLVERGGAVEGDPLRRVTQIWSLDGTLLAEIDPYKKTEVVQ